MTDDQLFVELERRNAEAEKDPSATVPCTELENESKGMVMATVRFF